MNGIPYTLQWVVLFPPKFPFLWGSGPMVPLANPSPQPKGHLDRFSRFFAGLTIPTDRQTTLLRV